MLTLYKTYKIRCFPFRTFSTKVQMFRLPLLPLPLKSRALSLEAADEVQEQQLAADKGTVLLLKEAGELPKFRYDEDEERTRTRLMLF